MVAIISTSKNARLLAARLNELNLCGLDNAVDSCNRRADRSLDADRETESRTVRSRQQGESSSIPTTGLVLGNSAVA